MKLILVVLLSVLGSQAFAAGFGSRKLCNIPFAIIGNVRASIAGVPVGQQYYLASPSGAPGPELRATRYYAALAKYGVFRTLRLRKPHIDWSNHREVADFYDWLSGQEAFLFHERPNRNKDLIYQAQAYQTAVYAKLVLIEAAQELRESAEKQESKDAVLKKSRALADAKAGSSEKAHSLALTKFLDAKELTPEERRARFAFLSAAETLPAPAEPRFAAGVPANTVARVRDAQALVTKSGPGAAAAVYRAILEETPGTWTNAQAESVMKKYRALVEPLLRREAPLSVLVRSLPALSDMITLHVPKSQSLGKDLPRTAYRSADGLLSVTFQRLANGVVRVEAMRVSNANQPPETYVAEWQEGTKRFEEKDHKTENNCFACHAVTPGRIDFRAQNMRGAAVVGANARTLARKIAQGETPEFAQTERAKEDTDKVMKKVKPGSAEQKQLEAWMNGLGG